MGLETTLLMNNSIEPYAQRPMLPLYILKIFRNNEDVDI